jgi:predicted nucleic acid-binding protein
MVTKRRALVDTSVFVGVETKRLDVSRFAGFEWGISAITLGDMRLGVLQAIDPEST